MGISGYRTSESELAYPNCSCLIYKMGIKANSRKEAADDMYSMYASRHCAKHSRGINFPPITLME